MSFNIGDFIYNLIRVFMNLTQTLYDTLNYEISLSWLNKLLSIIGVDAEIPANLTLLGLIGILGAGTLIVLMIYNLFK